MRTALHLKLTLAPNLKKKEEKADFESSPGRRLRGYAAVCKAAGIDPADTAMTFSGPVDRHGADAPRDDGGEW